MAPIIIYYSPSSPVARSVIFLANYLKLNVELKKVDMAAKEHLQEWYLKLNPQHTVPTLVDNGFVLTESRAILAYLVNSKAPESSLYPKCVKKRATIDSRLYFDATTLSVRLSNVGKDVMHKGKTEFDPQAKEQLFEAITMLNDFLKGKKWVAGNDLTISDFSIVGTLSTIIYMNAPMDKFPEVKRWFEQFKDFEGFETFSQGARDLAQFISSKLTKGF